MILSLGSHKATLSVSPAESSATLAGYTDVAVAITELGPVIVLDSLAFRVRDVESQRAVELVNSGLGACFSANGPLRVEAVTAPIERGVQLLAAYRFNILIMAAITLLVCALLISQATQISVRSIARELAILRTMGVTKAVCVGMVVAETVLVSAAGALLGVSLGMPLVVWIAGFLTSTASEIYNVSLSVEGGYRALQSGLITVGGMTLLGGAAGFFGARSLTQLAPYRGTRREQKHSQPIDISIALKVAAGATILATVIVLLLIVAPQSLLAYLSIGAILIWAGACIPLFVAKAADMLSPARRYLPVRLAYGALRESGRSFVLSGIAASVAIALLVGLALMVSSFRETLNRWSATRLAGDIFLSPTLSSSGNEGRIPQEVLKTIGELPEVRRVVPYFETTSTINAHPVVIGGVDLAAQCARSVYTFVAGGCVAPESSWEKQAIASESAAVKLGVVVGAEVSIDGEGYVIRGIVQEFGTEQPLLVINRDSFERRYRDHHPETITIDVVNVRELDVVQAKMREILPATVTVRNHNELLTLVETLFNRTFRVTDSVRWIVFVMALLGLVSTTAQHLWSRRRELRVSEVLGVSRGRLVCALTIEAVVVAASAVIVGVTAGVGIGWCLTEYINPLVFGWSLMFQISGWPCVESLVFVVAVGGVTALVAARMVRQIVASVGLEDE